MAAFCAPGVFPVRISRHFASALKCLLFPLHESWLLDPCAGHPPTSTLPLMLRGPPLASYNGLQPPPHVLGACRPRPPLGARWICDAPPEGSALTGASRRPTDPSQLPACDGLVRGSTKYVLGTRSPSGHAVRHPAHDRALTASRANENGLPARRVRSSMPTALSRGAYVVETDSFHEDPNRKDGDRGGLDQ